MKIATLVARYLLGLILTVFGLNGFFNFLPQAPLPDQAVQFFTLLVTTHYMVLVSSCSNSLGRTPLARNRISAGAHVDRSRPRQHPALPHHDEPERHCPWCDRNHLLADRLRKRPPCLRRHFPASLATKTAIVSPPRSI